MHKLKILHRNINLDTIKMRARNSKKLQFSLKGFAGLRFASILSHGPVVAHFQNAPQMAPEICLGSPHDYSADVWSIGQLALKLLSVLKTSQYDEVSNFKRLQLQDDVPDEVKEILIAMSNPDPSERPPLDDVLMHPWFSA